MKAALLEAIGKLTIIETEAPRLDDPRDLLIEVGATGICGSEVHAFKGTHPFRKPPSIMGHELAGRVLEVGASVDGFTPGERVAVLPYRTCGRCRWCRAGDSQVCPERMVMGVPGWPGGFGQVVAVPAQGAYRLPDHLSYVDGALVETIAVGVRSVARSGLAKGESAAIIGTGPIGLAVAAAARQAGAEKIICVDRQPHCLEVARRDLGASDVVLADGRPVADEIRALTGGEGADVVFMTVGVPSLLEDALLAVARHGRIVLVAIFDGPLTLDSHAVGGAEISLVGTSGYSPRDYEAALALISGGTVRAGAMVSHVLPLEQIQRGFDLADTKAEAAIKVMLEL